jgi:hypothetical protein
MEAKLDSNLKCFHQNSGFTRQEGSLFSLKKQRRNNASLCPNASGNYKLKVVFIGESKNPRTFKCIVPVAHPVWPISQRGVLVD